MPSKEVRRLLAVGSSRGITLPKAWVDGYNLDREGVEIIMFFGKAILVFPREMEAEMEKKASLIEELLS